LGEIQNETRLAIDKGSSIAKMLFSLGLGEVVIEAA